MALLVRALGLLALSLSAYAVRELRLAAFDAHQQSQRYEDIYYLPPAQWLPVLGLGFHDALADLIWCRSLVYFGEELGQQGKVKYAFDYTDAVLTLSPDFRQAYRWAGVLSMSRPTGAEFEEARLGATYLKRAVERWPHDGELHWDYGSHLRFNLAPLMKAGPEKDRVLAEAAPHLAAAASAGKGPAWLALNSSGLLERLGQNEQAIRHLEEVYGTVQDDMTKRKIEGRLAALRSQSFVEALKTANAQFEQERRQSYPYLSPSLFLILGPKPEERWADLVARRYLSEPPALVGPALEGGDVDAQASDEGAL